MKTQTATHTPTPWIQKGRQVQAGEYLADTINPFNGRESKTKMHRLNIRCLHEEDADLIIRAVNSHEQLIMVVKNLIEHPGDTLAVIQAKAVIAQAEGK
jgi:hypothetical protein